MRILWDERAWEEYLSWQAEDKKTLKRINALIKDIQRNPLRRDRKTGTAEGQSERMVEPQNR